MVTFDRHQRFLRLRYLTKCQVLSPAGPSLLESLRLASKSASASDIVFVASALHASPGGGGRYHPAAFNRTRRKTVEESHGRRQPSIHALGPSHGLCLSRSEDVPCAGKTLKKAKQADDRAPTSAPDSCHCPRCPQFAACCSPYPGNCSSHLPRSSGLAVIAMPTGSWLLTTTDAYSCCHANTNIHTAHRPTGRGHKAYRNPRPLTTNRSPKQTPPVAMSTAHRQANTAAKEPLSPLSLSSRLLQTSGRRPNPKKLLNLLPMRGPWHTRLWS